MGVIYETSSSSSSSKWNIWETIAAVVLRRSSGIGSSSSRRRQAALFTTPRTQPTTRRMSNTAKATAAAAGLTLAVLYAVGGTTTPREEGSNNSSSATISDSLRSTLYSWYAHCREYVAKNKNGLLIFGLGGGSADAEEEEEESPRKHEPEDRTILTHEGSCHCEAVAFEVRAPRTLHVRDIDHCASSTTLPQQHYPRARVKTSAFRLQPGCETSIQTYRVNDTAFSFCRQCGVPILTAVSLTTTLPPRHEESSSSSSSSSIALYINVDCLRPDSWIRKTIPKSKREHRAPKEYSGCQNQQPGGNKTPTKTESSSSPSVTTTTTTTSSSGSSGSSSEVLLSTIMGGEGSSMSSLHHNGGSGGHVDWPGGDAEEASHSEVSSTTSAFSSCGDDDDYPRHQEYSDLRDEKSPERLGLAPPRPRDQRQQFLTAANDMTKHAQLRQFMKKYSGSSSSEDHHPRQVTGKNDHHRHIA